MLSVQFGAVQNDESLFLEAYNIGDYERPSVTTDIAVLSMFAEDAQSHRKDAETKLHILLIKRGDHPFMNKWALPGGFLKPNETLESCARREIKEETNLEPQALYSVGIFSDPGRDPRGWIISNVFTSIVNVKQTQVLTGGDAINANWFEVDYGWESSNSFRLTLKSGEHTLDAVLRGSQTEIGNKHFEIVSNNGLAFDHAKIIATVLTTLRDKSENLVMPFYFLPEKFTLTSLQKMHEILSGKPQLSTNYRRKIAKYVEETEEFTSGIGHRPARLFRRKLHEDD